MNDKKHIDRLFQEKLRNFEATPSSSVWDNISAELETDNSKRKVIPLWLKISGIAVSLLLLVTLGNSIFNNEDNPSNENTIVNTSSQNEAGQTDKNTEANTNKATELQNATQDVNSNTIVTNENSDTEDSPNKEKDSKNAITESNNSSTASVSQKNNKVKANVNSKTNSVSKRDINSYNSTSVATNGVNTEKTTTNEEDNSILNKDNKALLKGNTSISDENAIAKTSNKDVKDLNSIDKSVLESVTDSTKTAVNDENKLSLTEELAALEENKEEDETKDQKTKPEDRWSVNSNVAPVYFNSLGKGSSIHSQFNSNTKSGDINMSYGLKGSYALNNKLSVRAGVNKVDLGYSTTGVVVYNNIQTTVEKPIKNIAFTDAAQDMSFISADEFAFGQIPSVLSDQVQGSIDQKLGFIEVPLELEYKLSQRKMGISVVGGVSALFLNKNEVYSTLQGQSTYIGKATNINSTSFSANLGIGIDFKLSKKFNFNLEPTFKYQLNTFNDTSGNFNPYFIGLYSGISFKF